MPDRLSPPGAPFWCSPSMCVRNRAFEMGIPPTPCFLSSSTHAVGVVPFLALTAAILTLEESSALCCPKYNVNERQKPHQIPRKPSGAGSASVTGLGWLLGSPRSGAPGG